MRVRAAQEALAVLGLGVGVALLFSSQVASTSLSGSVAQLSSGVFGGAQLQVKARSQSGMPEALLERARRVPGVLAVAPLLEHDARIAGPHGSRMVTLIGVDPRFVRLGGRLLRKVHAEALAAQEGIGLPEGISKDVGASNLQPVGLQVGSSSQSALVLYTLAAGEVGALAASPLVTAPLPYAQRLAGMSGRVSRLLVQVAPGAQAHVRAGLTRAMPAGVDVLDAGQEARVFSQAIAPTSDSTGLFAAVSALVGFLFAFDAMLLSAPSRRQLIGELHLDGYAAAQIARVLLLDALVLALAGTLLGLLAGEVASRELLRADPGYLVLAFPVGSARIVSWQCYAVACAGGVLAALAGVLAPLRGQLRATGSASSAAARAPGRIGRMLPAALGLACLAATGVLLVGRIASIAVGLVAMALLVLALLALLGGLFDSSVGALERLLRPLRGGPALLALFELRSPVTRPRRLAVAATGAVAALGSVAIGGAHHELQRGLDRASAAIARSADMWVLPYGPGNLFATSSFRDTVSARIRRLAGVRAVGDYRSAMLDWGSRRVWVTALPASDPNPILPGQLTRGDFQSAAARVRSGGRAVVSSALAAEHGLGVGSRFTLPAPHPIGLRVAALTTNDGWTPGAITMSPADYARAWGSGDPSALNVMLAAGVAPARARAEIQRALEPGSALRAVTGSERQRAIQAASRQGLARLTQIAAIVLVGAVLAMASALAAMIWQRRQRLAAMKVDGFGQYELWQTIACEGLLLLLVGCGIGALFGMYGQLVLTRVLTAATGFPVSGTFSPMTAGVVVTQLSLSAVAIVALVGVWAVRVAPGLALQEL